MPKNCLKVEEFEKKSSRMNYIVILYKSGELISIILLHSVNSLHLQKNQFITELPLNFIFYSRNPRNKYIMHRTYMP